MASTPHPSLGPLPVSGTSNDGVLPLDLLYEILLRLPTKPLCRFRAVCTSWRSLLCHRDFIAAHQRHHPGQRLAVGTCGYGACHVVAVILDMDSGRVIKHVSAQSTIPHHRSPHRKPSVSPDRAVCVLELGMDMRLSLMDFATRAISLLPEHAPPKDYTTTVSYTLGHMTSAGKYKVLAIATHEKHQRQVCKVLTLGGGGGNGEGGQRWRRRGSPSCRVVSPPLPSYTRVTTVIEGVAYFLVFGTSSWYHPELEREHDWIMAFNLDREVWRPAPIRGPTGCCGIGLGGLDGHLVACHDHHTCMQLWYLTDPDHALWSMLHKIIMPYHRLLSPSSLLPGWHHEYFEKPLAVLEDGRIVIWMRVPAAPGSSGILRVYDPRTGAFTDGTWVVNCHDMGVHSWNMLYSGRENGAK